jgi:hypothetical protein
MRRVTLFPLAVVGLLVLAISIAAPAYAGCGCKDSVSVLTEYKAVIGCLTYTDEAGVTTTWSQLINEYHLHFHCLCGLIPQTFCQPSASTEEGPGPDEYIQGEDPHCLWIGTPQHMICTTISPCDS